MFFCVAWRVSEDLSAPFSWMSLQRTPIILSWRDLMGEIKAMKRVKTREERGSSFSRKKKKGGVATDPSLCSTSSSLSPLNSDLGKDATEDFEEIGHSVAANEMLAKYKIGKLKGGDGGATARKQAASAVTTGAGGSGSGSGAAMKALQVLLPLLAVIAALVLPKLLSK